MLYQDTLTGMLHEVPDVQGYGEYGEDPLGIGEGQVVYDGFGNPVGFSFRKAFKSIGKFVKKAAPFATAFLGPYGQIINRALPVVRRALAPVARSTAATIRQQALQLPQVQQALPQFQQLPPDAVPELSGFHEGVVPVRPMPLMRPRLPAGWIRPPQPYTGRPGRRIYLRCSAWPGPRGLVPTIATQATPPAAAVTAAAVAPPATAMGRRRGRGRGRRR